jgi:putative restriction endonuclease
MYLPRLNEKLLNHRLLKKYDQEQIQNLIVNFFLSDLTNKELEKKFLNFNGSGEIASSILKHFGLNKKHRLGLDSLEELLDELLVNNYDKSFDNIINIVKNTKIVKERKQTKILMLKNLFEEISDNDLLIEKIVKVRNQFYQSKFRKILIEEFKSKCAFCNIDETDLLIAAHIIPFSDSLISPEQTFNHNNGILLCPIHDKLFENSKYLSLDGDGFLVFNRIKSKKLNAYLISISDKKISKLFLNKERKLFIKEHYIKFQDSY